MPPTEIASVTPRRCAASTISAANDAHRSDGSGPCTSTTSRPALPAHSSTVGQSIARTPPSAMRTVGRVCCRSSSSLRSIDANRRAEPIASPSAAIVPDPAKPASTQPVKANTITGLRSSGHWSTRSTPSTLGAHPSGAAADRSGSVRPCGCESSPSPSRARTTPTCRRSPGSARSWASTRSSGPITTWRSTATGCPGPTDAWLTLAALARDTTRIRLGTLVSPVTFRYPGSARDLGRAGRRDERRTGRARARHRMARRRARRVRDPVPAGRRALRAPRGAARDRHRPVVDTGRRALLVHRASTTRSPTRRRSRNRCSSRCR